MASLFGGGGPLAAVRNVATLVVDTLQTRLGLLANEIQVEKHQVLHQLTLGLALVFCLGLGVLLTVALAVLAWWPYRLWVLGVSVFALLGLTLYCLLALRRSLSESTPMLAATVAELQNDLRQLKAAAARESGGPRESETD